MSPSALVAGVGETGPARADPRSIPEMVLDAVERAIEDAGIGFGGIDAVVTASADLLDGLTASNVAVTEVVGAVMKPETRIAGDGLCAAIHAACQIRAGAYRTVLVAAHGKASMARFWDLSAWAMDPVHLQPLGADFLVCAGLQAAALAARDSRAEGRWAAAASERRAAAEPGGGEARTPGEILGSPPLASPLREGMCAPLADGACAVVLRAVEPGAGTGAQGPRRPVQVAGFGLDLDAHSPGDRDLAIWGGLAGACARAYALAGIDAGALDLAEPSCVFPHEEELFARAAGIGPRTAMSTGGGLFGGAVPVAAGLSRLAAAARALREPGNSRWGIAHGTWGPAGQGQAVAVLRAGAGGAAA
ncbi:MAG: hypothetical protein HY775_01660 [Acidobacteria bacterium]|nr:hypothetical protein [Acidobacteriota bacterium]